MQPGCPLYALGLLVPWCQPSLVPWCQPSLEALEEYVAIPVHKIKSYP